MQVTLTEHRAVPNTGPVFLALRVSQSAASARFEIRAWRAHAQGPSYCGCVPPQRCGHEPLVAQQPRYTILDRTMRRNDHDRL